MRVGSRQTLSLQRCTLRNSHEIEGQNARDNLRVKEGPNVRDQIALYEHYSFLVEVQTNAGYNIDPRALLHMTAMEGSTGLENDVGYILAAHVQ